jgi:GntR family transcriptional regulator/MocR family aminotransferase
MYYKQRRDFYTNVLKKILKMLSVLKKQRVVYGYSLIGGNSTFRTSATDFLPKTILYQDKDTCAIRLGFGHLNEEEIEIIVKN